MSDQTQLKAPPVTMKGVFRGATQGQYPKVYVEISEAYSYKAKDGSHKDVPASIPEFETYGDRIDLTKFQQGMPVTISFVVSGTTWMNPTTNKRSVFNKLRLESMVIGHSVSPAPANNYHGYPPQQPQQPQREYKPDINYQAADFGKGFQPAQTYGPPPVMPQGKEDDLPF